MLVHVSTASFAFHTTAQQSRTLQGQSSHARAGRSVKENRHVHVPTVASSAGLVHEAERNTLTLLLVC